MLLNFTLRISKSTFIVVFALSAFIRVNQRPIAFALPRPENLNGTQIKSDASHTLIFADQAKQNLAFGVICENPAFSASICVPIAFALPRPET
jgi:hypothetical protein